MYSNIFLVFKIIFISLICFSNINAKDLSMNIYDFEVKDINEDEISLNKYNGDVLLIVNVASLCTFTPQYEDLQKLYDKYKNKGFKILAFPSNQFSNQEPGTNEEIKQFCSINYNISFDIFDKIDVNGENTIPLYKYLKNQARGIFGTKSIKWNFTKFLINREGVVINRYSSFTNPFNIEDDIKDLL